MKIVASSCWICLLHFLPKEHCSINLLSMDFMLVYIPMFVQELRLLHCLCAAFVRLLSELQKLCALCELPCVAMCCIDDGTAI